MAYRPVLAFTATLAETVETFDASSFRAGMSALLSGVRPSDITLAVSGGSVAVSVTVVLPTEAAAAASLATLQQTNASALSAALRMPVEAIGPITRTSAAFHLPPPPSRPRPLSQAPSTATPPPSGTLESDGAALGSDGERGSALVLPLIVGGSVALAALAICAVLALCCRSNARDDGVAGEGRRGQGRVSRKVHLVATDSAAEREGQRWRRQSGGLPVSRSRDVGEGAEGAEGGAVAARGGAVAARGGAVAARGGAVAARGGAVAARGGAGAAGVWEGPPARSHTASSSSGGGTTRRPSCDLPAALKRARLAAKKRRTRDSRPAGQGEPLPATQQSPPLELELDVASCRSMDGTRQSDIDELHVHAYI